MADLIVAPESSADESPARKLFEPPAVEDLGKLQELTQLLQVTGEP